MGTPAGQDQSPENSLDLRKIDMNRVHECTDKCICPEHKKQMFYSKRENLHACQLIDCDFAHGYENHKWFEVEYKSTTSGYSDIVTKTTLPWDDPNRDILQDIRDFIKKAKETHRGNYYRSE